jgi:ABC-2 type transport system ATP-binding protein
METKTVKCPKCQQRITISGNPGEKIYLTCSNCNTKGVFTFPVDSVASPAPKQQISASAAIDVRGLIKDFNDVKAVNNISFTVQKGEIFGFLGPNGAGKTTTLKSVLGLIHPTAGDISINRINIKRDPKLAKQFIGYLPEKVAFYENLTALQNLKFYAELKGSSKEECQSLIREFGLGDAMNKKAGKFSKGMTQRLGMARAMLGKPPIYILDEPSGGLDPRGVLLIRNKIKDLKKQGATIFLSSHILSEVQEVCDRVGIINKGVLVAEDTVENLGKRLHLKPKIIVDLEKASDAIVEAVRGVEGVQTVETRDHSLEILCDPKAKSKVVVAIEKAGGAVLNLQTKETSLEEVFMKYTEEEA